MSRVEHPLARRGGNPAAIELGHQIRYVSGDDVDHLLCQRFVRREAHCFAHRAFRPIAIAPAQLRETADIGGGVMHLLLGHRILRVRIVPRLRLVLFLVGGWR